MTMYTLLNVTDNVIVTDSVLRVIVTSNYKWLRTLTVTIEQNETVLRDFYGQ